jgi:hypothetical protein
LTVVVIVNPVHKHLRPYSLSEAQRPDGNGIAHTLDFFPANKMDIQNGSTAQENEGDQQPSEMPKLGEKDKSQENYDHVPLVSETIRLQTLLLTIAVLAFAAGSRNKTHHGDRAISTYSEGASRPRERRSQVLLSRSSIRLNLSTTMRVMRSQAHRRPEARAEQPCLEGGWYAPETKEGRSSASP